MQGPAATMQRPIEGCGLDYGARKAIEDETVGAVFALQAGFDDRDDQGVRHEGAAVHIGFGLATEGRAVPVLFA